MNIFPEYLSCMIVSVHMYRAYEYSRLSRSQRDGSAGVVYQHGKNGKKHDMSKPWHTMMKHQIPL